MDHLLCQELRGPPLLGLSPQTCRRHSVWLSGKRTILETRGRVIKKKWCNPVLRSGLYFHRDNISWLDFCHSLFKSLCKNSLQGIREFVQKCLNQRLLSIISSLLAAFGIRSLLLVKGICFCGIAMTESAVTDMTDTTSLLMGYCPCLCLLLFISYS